MISIIKIAESIDGTIEGNSGLLIKDICELGGGKPDCISFISHSSYSDLYLKSDAQAVIAEIAMELPKSSKTIVRVDNPTLAFSKVSLMFRPKITFVSGIHKSAEVSNSAIIGSNVFIGPNVFIGNNVIIGENVNIHANTTVGHNSIIGSNSEIMSNVSIYYNVKIGNNVHIDSGTVIGSDGFGLVNDNGVNLRVSHTGNVEIDDYVSIGANCCIDRATINSTYIGKYSKLDNLIQIAHNVVIGEGCIIAGQSGIAGSTVIGKFVTIGGRSGIIGHIEVGDNCVIAATTLVTKTLKPGSFVSGNPARDHMKRKRQEAIINQLPQLFKRVIHLEKELNDIKKD